MSGKKLLKGLGSVGAAVRGGRRRWWAATAMFFALLGPGIITSNVDNDAGGITTYSLAGAEYGMELLWTLIPITIALVIIQEMCSRMGVVSGKGLSDLIRERFGARITFYLMIGLFLTNLGNTVSEFAGVAASLELFGVSRYVSVPVAAIFVWWLIVKGTYKSIEKIFLAACVFYVSYIISGFMVKPDWAQAWHGLVRPSMNVNSASITMILGLVGTTIAPWMQFYLQSSIVDKGIKIEQYGYTKVDVVVGSVTVNVIAFFIILLCAFTLHQHNIKIETARDAALALKPLAGQYCFYLFAFGLLNASLFAASILPLSSAYTICEAFGWEASLNKKFAEAPMFYGIYSLMILLGAGVILLPNIPLISIMYYSQVINGIVLPVILTFMIVLINDRSIMGDYVNGKVLNTVSWATVIVLAVLSLALVVTSIM